MPKFDAHTIEPMEYDFTEFRKNAGLPDDAPGVWAGTIPEPTHEMVGAYFTEMSDIALEAAQAEEETIASFRTSRRDEFRAAHPDDGRNDTELDGVLTEEETVEVIRARFGLLAAAREQSRRKQADRINANIAMLCQNKPGVDVLVHLPHRIVDGFTGWLSGQFSPEALTAATRAR